MLKVENLTVGYGEFVAAEKITFEVNAGDIFALIGPNGAGKTSILMSIAGHVEIKNGRVTLKNEDITFVPPYKKIKYGIAIVPEGRELFSDLTVKENLIVGNYAFPRKYEAQRMEYVFDLFPRLKERINQISGTLSGGEQQMLAIGRALMSNPDLLMIDEMSLGLMPKAVNLCYDAIMKLKEDGVTTIIVEQNTAKALKVADHVLVLESGKKVWEGTGEEARNDSSLIDAYLGIKNAEVNND